MTSQNIYTKISLDLKDKADTNQAEILQRFFKTGKGQYGEGDIFLGIKVPIQRQIAKKYYQDIELKDIEKLINSQYHEFRLTGLIILTYKYLKATSLEKNNYFKFYLKNTKKINNWDLVDLSAPNIVGNWLLEKDKKVLYKFAQSNNLWQKRISIVATHSFIRHNDFSDTLKIADILLYDQHDLIQKAVGWMLREVGKRNKITLINFLQTRYQTMPRTMLRYAIEKFSDKERKHYLKKTV